MRYAERIGQLADLALGMLGAMTGRWEGIIAVLILILVRRWSVFARGVLELPAGWPFHAAAWPVTPLVLILLPGAHAFMSSDEAEPTAEPRTPRSEDLNPRSTHQDAIVQRVQRSDPPPEPVILEPPNANELRCLAEAIRHNARGATKQQALEAAFGVRKGGGAGWRRASQLFDQAMAPPPDPYPHLQAQQRPAWEPGTEE